jgi:MerR family mercuric resistance operon transcriptional regulator
MKIGEVSAASGCHIETIRYYERIGLLPAPARTEGGYRCYDRRDVERLRFITRGRALGFSLEEVASLLQLAGAAEMPCDEVDRLARQHLDDIRGRIADLQRMAAELQATIAECGGGQRARCAILAALRTGENETVRKLRDPVEVRRTRATGRRK